MPKKKHHEKEKEVKCHNILSYFTNPTKNSTLTCPGCQQLIIKQQINEHLDNECPSRNNDFENLSNEIQCCTELINESVEQSSAELVKEDEIKKGTEKCLSVSSAKRKCTLSLKDRRLEGSNKNKFYSSEEIPIKKQKYGKNCCSEIDHNSDSDGEYEKADSDSKQNVDDLKDIDISRSPTQNLSILKGKKELSKELNTSNTNENFELLLSNKVTPEKIHDDTTENTSTEKSPSSNNKNLITVDSFPSSSQNSNYSENIMMKRPYYLENFLLVLKAVFTDPDDSLLFNEEDKAVLNKFYNLTDPAKQLYVRLFQRKLAWIPISKIKYSEISDNLTDVINELIMTEFINNDASLNDIHTVLDMLQTTDLKEIMKTFNLIPTKFQKHIIIDQILKYSKQQKLIFSSSSSITNEQIILKKAKSLLQSCIKINDHYREVFQRAIILFSLTSYSPTNEDEISGKQQLLTILLVNMRKLIFPSYDVLRERKLFLDRDDLIRYVHACELEAEIISLMELHQFEKGVNLYRKIKEFYQQFQEVHFCEKKFLDMPEFLRRYTVGAVYIRCLSYGIEVLQRLKLYSEAVTQLKDLLIQKLYHQDWRGRWTERLVLNLEQHLKQPEEALEIILESFNDPWIRTGHRLDLFFRAQRIIKTKKAKQLKKYLEKLPPIPMATIPEVFIEGYRLPNQVTGNKSYFVNQETSLDNTEESTLCTVEELAKNHYFKLGYSEGIHGESSVPCSIYGLLFWDIIYMSDIADVFRNPYQAFPLDLNTDGFYHSRSSLIEERLQWIRSSTHDELTSNMLDVWIKHENELSLVSWTNFRDFNQLQTLVECINPKTIADICEKYAKDFRHCRSGFPDLTVWNPSESIFKIVEVKGPNDRLSSKQIVWLNFLLSLGINAEVCHVSAAGAKRLKKSSFDKK